MSFDGEVLIEFIIDENGNHEERIIDHLGNSSCLTEDDAAIINDLLGYAIPEFGDFGEIGSSGKDWEQINECKMKEKPKKVKAPFEGDDGDDNPPGGKSKERVGLGFGV